MISSVNRNEDERFMGHKNFKRQKNQKSLSVSFLTDDLQTLAHVEDKVKKCSLVAKYEKNKYSYWHTKQRLLQEKPVWFTPCVQL